jgi:hypothetical protein
MADEADAFAGPHVEIDAIKRTNGAEMLFGVVQFDNRTGCIRQGCYITS